jgi:hypothetical protein
MFLIIQVINHMGTAIPIIKILGQIRILVQKTVTTFKTRIFNLDLNLELHGTLNQME